MGSFEETSEQVWGQEGPTLNGRRSGAAAGGRSRGRAPVQGKRFR